MVKLSSEAKIIKIIGCRSPLTRKGYNTKQYLENKADGDISFVSTGRQSIERMLPPLYNNSETGSRTSCGSDPDESSSFESIFQGRKSTESFLPPEFTSLSFDSERLSSSTSQAVVSE
jgi:nucleoredoxin